MTIIQTSALLAKALCLLIMMIELTILLWEIWKIKEFRMLGQQQFNPMTEAERRKD